MLFSQKMAAVTAATKARVIAEGSSVLRRTVDPRSHFSTLAVTAAPLVERLESRTALRLAALRKSGERFAYELNQADLDDCTDHESTWIVVSNPLVFNTTPRRDARRGVRFAISHRQRSPVFVSFPDQKCQMMSDAPMMA
jgi:hypothetical protein